MCLAAFSYRCLFWNLRSRKLSFKGVAQSCFYEPIQLKDYLIFHKLTWNTNSTTAGVILSESLCFTIIVGFKNYVSLCPIITTAMKNAISLFLIITIAKVLFGCSASGYQVLCKIMQGFHNPEDSFTILPFKIILIF